MLNPQIHKTLFRGRGKQLNILTLFTKYGNIQITQIFSNLQREFFRFLLFFTQTGRQPKLPILCLGFWLSSRLGKKEEKSKRLTLYNLGLARYLSVETAWFLFPIYMILSVVITRVRTVKHRFSS